MSNGWTGPLGYPVTGERREEPLLSCWILCLLAFPVPVLPLVPVLGYLVRVLGAAANGADAPSVLADPVALVRTGVGGVLVAVAYLAVPVVVLLVTLSGATGSAGNPDLTFGSGVLFYAGATAVLFFASLGAYLCPIGLYAYGATGRLRAAVAPGHVVEIATHAAYFPRWVAGATVLVAATGLALAGASAGRVGPVLSAGVFAYGAILSASLWGRAIGTAERR